MPAFKEAPAFRRGEHVTFPWSAISAGARWRRDPISGSKSWDRSGTTLCA